MSYVHLTMYLNDTQHCICLVGCITENITVTLSDWPAFVSMNGSYHFKLRKIIDHEDVRTHRITTDLKRRFVKAPDELPKYLRFFGYFAAKQEQINMLALNIIVPITIALRVISVGAIALDYFNQVVDRLTGMLLRAKRTQANHLAHKMLFKFGINNSPDRFVVGLNVYSVVRSVNSKYFHPPIIPKVLFQKWSDGRLRGIEHLNNRGRRQNKKFQKIFPGTFSSGSDVIIAMVTLPGLEPGLPP